MTLSQRAVEAAARAAYHATPRNKPYDVLTLHKKNLYRSEAEAAITAALAVDGLCLVDQREEQPSDLRLGDRVRVSMRRRKLMYETEPFWRGQIVGETRDGNGWVVRRDLYKTPVAYHKSFCSKEGPAASDGESPPAGTEG